MIRHTEKERYRDGGYIDRQQYRETERQTKTESHSHAYTNQRNDEIYR